MPSNPEATQSVLDQMTAEIGARKAGKAIKPAGLTPVGVEPGGPMVSIPEVPGVFLTNEAIADIAKDLRTQAAVLITAAEGLDTLTGLPSISTHAPVRIYAAAEVVQPPANDFDAQFAAKAAAAQAATFADAPAPPGATATSTWRCPVHPKDATKALTSRRGRKYLACTVVDCQQEERLGVKS